jgi:hypothetical protein
MSLLPYKHGYSPKIGLKSNECIDFVLQPLKDHVTIKVNGSLTRGNPQHSSHEPQIRQKTSSWEGSS